MKKLFTLLLVALVGLLPAVAETAVFDFEDLTTLDPTPNPNKNGGPGQPTFINANGTYAAGSASLTIYEQWNTAKFQKQSGKTWLNAYSNSTYTFTPAEGYKITKITATPYSGYENYISNVTLSNGEGTLSNGVYTAPEGGVETVELKITTTFRLANFTVELSKAGGDVVVEEVESTFNFQDYASLDPEPSTMGTVNIPNGRFTTPQYKANGYSSTYNGVTLTLSGSSDTRLYFDKSTPHLYLFATSGSNTSDINLKAQSGYSIQSVVFTLNDNYSRTYVQTGDNCKGTYDSSTGTYTAAEGGETDITFSAKNNAKFYNILIKLLKTSGGDEPEIHTPSALSYVLSGAEAVAMDKFAAKNIEITAGATLSFIDSDGYAYGAAEANELLANSTATALTEYAPANAADVKAFKIAESGIYNITTSFRNGTNTVTLVKVADPLINDLGQSVATFNWSLPESLNPASEIGTFYRKTFTANGISAEFDPGMAPSDARFVALSNGKTVLRLYSQYSITLTAPAGKVIYNVKISGESINSSNTSIENASISSNGGVYTIIPDYETNTCVIKILNQVEFSYMTVTYADAYAPEELYYVTNNGDTFTAMTVDESNSKIFVAKEAQIGEWGKKGTLKFSEAGASYLLSMSYSCGAPAEGTTAEEGKEMTMVGAEELDESAWYSYSVEPGIYTITVSFVTGAPVMTLTKTGDIKQPKPTTMYAIASGFEEPLELHLMGNSLLANDVTLGTAMGQSITIYFAESEDIADGRTYGAAEADAAYNFEEWYNAMTEFAVGASTNRFTIPSGIYNIDINIENDQFMLRMSKQGELMPAALSIYNGEELTAMTADTDAKTFTVADYNIGEWGKPGTIKFTTAFIDMMFGDAYACGAETEGAIAEAGQEYTMTGKDKMPIDEWYAYTVAEGIYTVTVSFATGKPVMTLTKTADFDQPKPTTMYVVSDGLEAPVELTLMGNSFLSGDDIPLGTTPDATVTVYFAENADTATGRTWGAATADEPYDFTKWTVDLTEAAAGTEANVFTLPAAIYKFDVNIENDTLKVRISKQGELSGLENIEAAEADVEYYNLQGVRVANPTTGIYIRVQGSKATKVSIR